ncbi:predicted protein [Histoplasma mississippiense (nom. inval.)]|uniref:predicted protein n=2 Tax=Ajellomyces capsulatus (strain NAm1 / WU24) TaxID=2059318 RepID=UPI000157BC3E|nr:predicted protein [Histoplasma mississippiense (nom. inval.)]XP_001542077.1 predicted protein [Histoplasma mississippiense (nom. inval.)]EDN05645.1 predicted protein [Histoplasma mississippiense (nom. inval.)]EDN08220.1 predicted protein [Histoplasma mississippiense (nom. inval.)]
MASADSPRDGLHHTVVISSDSEMDERQPPARKLRRKRPRTDYSYPMYEAQFDDPAPSEMWQPPKRRKMPNLDTVLETANQEIHNIFEAEHARTEALEKEVQRLRAEMARKDERVDKLETKVRELKYQCRCQICFTIPSGWRTLLCGHRYCPKCVPPIGETCATCRQVIAGVIKSY